MRKDMHVQHFYKKMRICLLLSLRILKYTYKVLSPVNPANIELLNFVSWLSVICLYRVRKKEIAVKYDMWN